MCIFCRFLVLAGWLVGWLDVSATGSRIEGLASSIQNLKSRVQEAGSRTLI